MPGTLKVFAFYLITASWTAAAQTYADKWFFGYNAGLDFSSNPPTVMHGALHAYEGTAVMSDSMGNLLFYTDGLTLYNKSHVVMANGTGLNGHMSTTQGALIVPDPGNVNQYYVFTLDAFGLGNGLCYSKVDMTLAAGAGSVISKNNFLFAPLTEKMAAAPHCNGTDYWVVVHELNSNNFRSYQVSAAGVSTAAIVSSFGSNHIHPFGHMKFSQSGRRLGLVTLSASMPPSLPGYVELFRFDNSTGQISDPQLLCTQFGGFGCEFSADESKFYAGPFLHDSVYFQWDLCAESTTAIVSSQDTLDMKMGKPWSMQLAPDGKIYVVSERAQALGVINQPGLAGSACGYWPFMQPIAPDSAAQGLPNFVAGFIPPSLSDINWYSSPQACRSFTFYSSAACLIQANPGTHIQWDFGDSGSGAANTSSLAQPAHSFSSAGNFTVTATVYFPCFTKAHSFSLSVQAEPSILVNGLPGAQFTVCPEQVLILHLSGSHSYSVNNLAANNTFTVGSTSSSFVITGRDTLSGCLASKTISVFAAGCAGLKHVETNLIALSPNPVAGNELSVYWQRDKHEITSIVITDFNGKVWSEIAIANEPAKVWVANLSNGVYMLSIRNRERSLGTRKLVICR